ncbi:ABC transporter ATP-binding protein [Mycetocola lacteus]|uniref:ABC transporter ATP-binding protein n=1 Tax=Mycetocola lacteus TaxID=76637 RepID=A0A3L7AWX4_9MICO|nr:ABC transporter ATP-binding protein [Mycetocola lacteus]RLP84058.1 ABC transporter ATP-binding protein [Mycetocola lacteus]
MTIPLQARGVTLGYDTTVVAENLSVDIPDGRFTVIIGPNACGKSTLLSALSRLTRPRAGQVLLDGADIHALDTRTVARRLGLLPQGSVAPHGISVLDLISRGRFAHQGLLRRWSEDDRKATRYAMEATGVTHLAQRNVDELSGGQRQRVWLAMVLAQQTPLVLLDEPTTYLDLSHQLDTLRLCRSLVQNEGKTLVAVLHDLNQAARYADHVIALNEGRVIATGSPEEVVTSEIVRSVFNVDALVIPDPVTGRPLIVPTEKELPARG